MAKLDTLTLRQEAAKKILNGEVSDKVLESIMKEDIAFSTTVLRSVDILVDGKVVPHETTAKEVFDYVKKSPYYDALMEDLEDAHNKYSMQKKRARDARDAIKAGKEPKK